jgi:sterol desaturase/sphingolipid hydroxylase (fatty acid hydroxylase superfamily)
LVEAITSEFAELVAMLRDKILLTLATPNATLSLANLTIAALIAIWWVSRSRRRSLRVLIRALFPHRWLFGASARADWVFAAFNILFIGIMFSWAVLSAVTVTDAVHMALTASFGTVAAPSLPGWAATTLVTLLLYFAFELGYFLDHLLKHKVPLLWHFHRVHHLAETLGPATFHRLHPVDTLIFYNIVALFMGGMSGLCAWALPTIDEQTLWGANAALALAAFVITPLQHSHVWIPATGWLGRVILSPAHHQLHHSDDPLHHNRNLGSTLALFDWLAATLIVPEKRRPRLVFGAGHYPVNPHSLRGAWWQPFVEAWQAIQGSRQGRDSATQPVAR